MPSVLTLEVKLTIFSSLFAQFSFRFRLRKMWIECSRWNVNLCNAFEFINLIPSVRSNVIKNWWKLFDDEHEKLVFHGKSSSIVGSQCKQSFGAASTIQLRFKTCQQTSLREETRRESFSLVLSQRQTFLRTETISICWDKLNCVTQTTRFCNLQAAEFKGALYAFCIFKMLENNTRGWWNRET